MEEIAIELMEALSVFLNCADSMQTLYYIPDGQARYVQGVTLQARIFSWPPRLLRRLPWYWYPPIRSHRFDLTLALAIFTIT